MDADLALDLEVTPIALWLLQTRTDDFRQPEESHLDLAREAAQKKDVLAERLTGELRVLRDARTAAGFRALRRFWLPVIVGIVAGLAGVAALILAVNMVGETAQMVLLIVAAGCVVIVAASALGALLASSDARRRWAARRTTAEDLNEAFTDAVAELLREIILERTPVSKSWGSTFDSEFAPTLVGIGIRQAISSASYTELHQFVAEHPTSAIGIAGPRGVGKSTLMEKLIEQRRREAVGVRIPAPKRYEPGALIRLIHASVAQEILHPGAGLRSPVDPTRGRLQVLRRLATGFAFVAVVALIIFLWEIDSADRDSYGGSAGIRIGALTVLCIVAFGAWLGLLLRATWLTLWSLRRETILLPNSPNNTWRRAMKLANRELDYLRYTATSQSKSGTGVKLGLFNLTGEDQLSLAERQPTEADSVDRLRQFLRELTRVTEQRVVICVDELDKMDEPKDVVAVVNSIKDLFHVRGVHVLVSVSTDAMHSFAARGVLVRDVFDSAFDTVVEVRRLTSKESADLLARRATDFSFPAMYFCHAWSGGHPRDLIRAARGCVTYRAKERRPIALADVVDSVLLADVLAVLRATINKLTADVASAGLASDVVAFRDLVDEEAGPLHARIRGALQVTELPNNDGPVTEAGMLAAMLAPYLALAAQLSEFFSVARTPEQWRTDAVRDAVKLFAAAQVSLAGHPDEAKHAVDRARGTPAGVDTITAH